MSYVGPNPTNSKKPLYRGFFTTMTLGLWLVISSSHRQLGHQLQGFILNTFFDRR